MQDETFQLLETTKDILDKFLEELKLELERVLKKLQNIYYN